MEEYEQKLEEILTEALEPLKLLEYTKAILFTRSIKNELALPARFLWNVNEGIEPST